MMSKNSFLAKWKNNGKNFLFDFFVLFLCFFFTFPISLLTRLNSLTEQFQMDFFDRSEGTLQEILRQHAHLDFAGSGEKVILAAVLGAFLAFRCFYYLYSRKKMDFYESQPVSRNQRFWKQYAGGVVCFFLAYLLNFLIAILIAAGNGAMTGSAFGIGLHGFLEILLSFLGAYHLTILSISITGNIISGILGMLVLEFYEIGVCVCAVFFRDRYMQTMSSYYGRNNEITVLTNVQWQLVKGYENSGVQIEKSENFIGRIFSETAPGMLHAAVLVLLFLALAYVAYKKRPAEAAGKTIAFSLLRPVLKVLLVMFGGIGCCLLFQVIFSDGMGFAVFGLLFGIVLTGGITQMVFEQDIRAFFRKPLQMAAGGVIAAFIFAVFVFDLTGYDRYCPDAEDVESCAIMLWDLESGKEYLDSRDKSVPAIHHVLSEMKLGTVEEINEFMKKRIKSDNRNGGYAGYEKPVLDAELCWRLKNGKTEYREVTVYQEDVEDALSVILSQDEYKRAMFQIYDDDMLSRAGKIELSYQNGVSCKELPNASVKEFQEAYEKDMENYGYELEKQLPIGYVNVELSEKRKLTNDFSEYFQFDCYIYNCFENTKRFLARMGITSLTANVENAPVYSVRITALADTQDGDGYEEAVSEEDGTIVISDKEKIQDILDVIQVHDLMISPFIKLDKDGELFQWGEGIDVELQCDTTRDDTLADGYYCNSESVGGVLFKNKIPQWLKEELARE